MHKIIRKEPFKNTTIEEVENIDLAYLQEQVGGMIEIVPLELNKGYVDIVLNEEGKWIGLVPNIKYGSRDVIVGNIIICTSDEMGNSVGLSDEEIKEVENLINSISFNGIQEFLDFMRGI